MSHINDRDPRPPYLQIVEELREAIEDGRYKSGDRLGSTRELATEYGVSHTTVNHAVRLLREKGMVDTWPGRGVFVRDPAKQQREPMSKESSVADIADQLGRVIGELTELKARIFRLDTSRGTRKV